MSCIIYIKVRNLCVGCNTFSPIKTQTQTQLHMSVKIKCVCGFQFIWWGNKTTKKHSWFVSLQRKLQLQKYKIFFHTKYNHCIWRTIYSPVLLPFLSTYLSSPKWACVLACSDRTHEHQWSQYNKIEKTFWILVKFMFSKKATKIDKIFNVDLMLCSKRQIDGKDFVNFRGLLGKYEH